MFDRLVIWVSSVSAVIAAPCLPLVIEFFKNGTIGRENILLTASVLSAGFFFSAEHRLYQLLYAVLFVTTLLLDFALGNPSFSTAVGTRVGTLLLSVACLHASERFWWHVVHNRPFPDRPGGE